MALDSAWVGRSGIPALAPQPVSSMDVFAHENICAGLTAVFWQDCEVQQGLHGAQPDS